MYFPVQSNGVNVGAAIRRPAGKCFVLAAALANPEHCTARETNGRPYMQYRTLYFEYQFVYHPILLQ